MKNPCNKCVDRHFMCHADCKKYQEFKLGMDEIKKKVSENAAMESFLTDIRKRLSRYGGK